jgi:hypothetical protein
VSLVNSACRLTGRDALAITPENSSRRRRIVDHTVSLLPAMSRPPRRKRPQVNKRRSAATG